MLFAPALIAPVCAKAIVAGGVAVGAACAGKVVSDAVGWSWSPSEADCYDYCSYATGPVGTYAKKYIVDKPLPRDKNGEPIPDADAPHTQLGTKSGRKGKYPQAREFDENGNPVRDIDFTDHGRPDHHPNPHQHPIEPNPTGGTPKRGPSQPLENWEY